ncbi:MAG: hypothetical protein A3B99_01645 [Candidatus Yanofskybacteria bacterium RIFCSPHIGHO2_02_FULL_44_12b]|uniref:Ribbon-helix-helix protein CopG domain-containing protein n=2 Tax=Candidatus Yanofskyibacteriota TaxID=1752733 RepID=A0A1F8GJK6_9BACT|nr:MAG: hypothetical protein UW79_C0020G0005 [Candidatus Yanofskybacteria bacterium GW2011_GWA2_44_9]OGN04889.1 MAG: hypothetical protein A2659_04785 [Candidatus Yanofskybacteria bacterium RIFCSPHIGHO2_01_FULL_44_24]OGN16236.1 MAG: hypothetical protein A3B99_01645 [Candidatus Yanofskybacteria bacterium RIFCSPHIGHO2_02_FULL_44_12b]OGN25585.1 MAG: hypothetical protein A2925_05190 [Candidatus Yanofskybacteria bacterium RIFCSPLOWO2_01_FULL_44_22]
MRKNRAALVDLELSKEAWKELERIARRSKLTTGKVVDLILGAEMDIIEYQVRRRKRLAKRLKTRFPKCVLYMKSL